MTDLWDLSIQQHAVNLSGCQMFAGCNKAAIALRGTLLICAPYAAK